MPISSVVNRVSYSGNGVTVAFSFPYYFLAQGDLVVIEKNTTTGVETTKTITTHYTVAGAGETSGGTVTMLVAPATGTTLIIYRNPALTQGLDLTENDSLPADSQEQALDRLTMIAQRLSDRVDRSLRLTDGFSSAFDTKLPSLLEAGAVLVVNDAGTGLDTGPTVTEIEEAVVQATAAAASASAGASSAAAAAASATLASEWAQKTSAAVTGSSYSAKEHAQGTLTRGAASGGSAKDWAQYLGGTVDNTEFSAKKYAQDAATSATAAQSAASSQIWRDVVFLTFADSPRTILAAERGKMFAVDCSGGGVSVILPQISTLDLTTGFVIGLKKTDGSGNSISVARSGTDTIDGATSKSLGVADGGAVFIPDTDTSPDEWTTSEFGAQAGNLTVDLFSGNGSTTGFTLSVDPGSENNTFVFVDGVYQQKDTYSLSGTTLTFSGAPPTGTNNIQVVSGTTLSIGTPSDGTVSRAKLAAGAMSGNVVSRSTNTTVSLSEDVILVSGVHTETLPTAVGNSGKIFEFVKTDDDFDVITIDGNGTETIRGALTFKLCTYGESVKIISDGANWQILQHNIPGITKTYTPALTQMQTPSNLSATWRRDRDCVVIVGNVTINSVISGTGQWELPTGLTSAGASKIPALTLAGHMGNAADSTREFYVMINSGRTYLTFARNDFTEASTGSIISVGDVLKFTARFPVADWEG